MIDRLPRRRVLPLVAAAALAPGLARAQGFAGLGSIAEAFAIPERGRQLRFPQDHGPHWAYRIEWWYLTAVLTGADGQDYGVQWTLFRSALAPEAGAGWSAPQLWMGHAGLTTATAHHSAERLARGRIGQAGVTSAPFEAWIDDWALTGTAQSGQDELDDLRIRAQGADFGYDLRATAEGPLVLQGDAGYSVKSPAGQASHYYSQPFYRLAGRLDLPAGPVPVTGQGWLDREWSSQPLAADQSGWDWVSLIFEGGARMMGFRLRGAETFTSGTWIAPDGTPAPLPPNALRFTALEDATVAGRRVPVRWRLDWPEGGLVIETRPLNPHSWMATSIPYWEGPLRFDGTHRGRGYLEMTGY
jgi:predicted secreted hydrolase